MHDAFGGQHCGQGASFSGGASGHGGFGGTFVPKRHVPALQRAMRDPQRPKSHVVPSGIEHSVPFAGSVLGQLAFSTEPVPTPPSPSPVTSKPSVLQAALAATNGSVAAATRKANRRDFTAARIEL